MTGERPGWNPVRVLFLNGAVGVGKSTVADAVGALLETAGIPHAVIDLDGLRRGWPPPEGDRFNSAIELANLRPVAANYVDAGARILVLAGVIEEAQAVDLYTDALGGVRPTVIRLRVDPADTEALVTEDGVEHFEMRGRSMSGWVRVDAAVVGSDEQLQRWVDVGLAYAGSLPPK